MHLIIEVNSSISYSNLSTMRRSKAERKRIKALRRLKKFEEKITFLARTGTTLPHEDSTEDYFGVFRKRSKENPSYRKLMVRCFMAIYREDQEIRLLSQHFVKPLSYLCKHDEFFIGNPNRWKAPTGRQADSGRHFLKHMMLRYPVPSFAMRVWERRNYREWLWTSLLGKGFSLSDFPKLPFPVSSKMASYLWEVPEISDWDHALLWIRFRALGADHWLTERLIQRHIWNVDLLNENGNRVIRYLSTQPPQNGMDYAAIIDYLISKVDAEPALKLQGRNFERVAEEAFRWRLEQKDRGYASIFRCWDALDLPKLRLTAAEADYQIIELTNSEMLQREGVVMRHCVGRYDENCEDGTSRIFSLRKTHQQEETTLATIEYSPKFNKIIQARAQNNSLLTRESRDIVNLWAKTAKIHREDED